MSTTLGQQGRAFSVAVCFPNFCFPTGTGVVCIYPLLGSKINKWRFVATDISKEAVESATKNVIANHLQDFIDGKASQY
jgi:23S rRNA A1618 N6-methylase RlmF